MIGCSANNPGIRANFKKSIAAEATSHASHVEHVCRHFAETKGAFPPSSLPHYSIIDRPFPSFGAVACLSLGPEPDRLEAPEAKTLWNRNPVLGGNGLGRFKKSRREKE